MASETPASPQQSDDHDIHSAALCAWKEARGEGTNGICAVLHVLRNRVRDARQLGFPTNLHDVVFAKNQFTSMSVPSDPEFNLQPAPDDPQFADALGLAKQIFGDGQLTDPTDGAHYYANLHVIPTDGWFYRNIVLNSSIHPVRAQIGKHTFFA